MLAHRVIRQMRVPILGVSRVVVGEPETQIRPSIEPDRQRVPGRDQHPLTDVELFRTHNLRILNVPGGAGEKGGDRMFKDTPVATRYYLTKHDVAPSFERDDEDDLRSSFRQHYARLKN